MTPHIDMSDDYGAGLSASTQHTEAKPQFNNLLISPPALASDEARLQALLSTYDVRPDLQMLDRLAMNIVSLPSNHYDNIILASSDDASVATLATLLPRLLEALKPGRSIHVPPGPQGTLKSDAIVSGFVVNAGDDGMILTKPESQGPKSVLLRKRKPNADKAKKLRETLSNNPGNATKIDENQLLQASDYVRPIIVPPECTPATGKRRKACKDCTCGLKEMEEEEIRAMNERQTKVSLASDDLAEIDFTAMGSKNPVSSCGSCYLGDAFRCSGCPYLGMPAFKPGEKIQLSKNFGDDL